MIDRREAVKRITLVLGGALSAPTLAGVLGGCRADTEPGLRVLSPAQRDLLDLVTEAIIPETDTPGARAARVPDFIDAMLADFFPDDARRRFLEGLDGVDARANAMYGKPFAGIAPDEQTALLNALDEAAYPDPNAMSEADLAAFQEEVDQNGKPFFATLKELTISGYYTSEIGATQELHLNPYVEYRGDIPYDEVGRAWA